MSNLFLNYRVYAVIVVTGALLRTPLARRNTDGSLRSPRDIIGDIGDSLPAPYDPVGPKDLYTAAIWTNSDDIPDVFVVGSGSTTRGPDGTEYVNVKLSDGTEYGVFNYIRLESDDGVSVSSLSCISLLLHTGYIIINFLNCLFVINDTI